MAELERAAMQEVKNPDLISVLVALLNSNVGSLVLLLAVAMAVLWAARAGYLSWSTSRVQASSDAGSIAVLQSMRDEITRLQTKNEQLDKQVEAERASCAQRLEAMNETISKLRERVAILEMNHGL